MAVVALLGVAARAGEFHVHGGSTRQTSSARKTGLLVGVLYQRPVDASRSAGCILQSSASRRPRRFFTQIQLKRHHRIPKRPRCIVFRPARGSTRYGQTDPAIFGRLAGEQLKARQGRAVQKPGSYRKAVLSALSDVEKALIALQNSLQEKKEACRTTSWLRLRKAFDCRREPVARAHRQLITVLQDQQRVHGGKTTMGSRLSKLLAASSLFHGVAAEDTTAGI